jgi:cytochrome oxidase Cu insertion factor (SCO1/SenC/PrrC family)
MNQFITKMDKKVKQNSMVLKFSVNPERDIVEFFHL